MESSLLPQTGAIPIMPPESIGLVVPNVVVPQLPPLGSLSTVAAPGTSRDPGSYLPLDQAPGSGRDPGRSRSPSARASAMPVADCRIDESVPFVDLTAELSLIIDGSNRKAIDDAVEFRERTLAQHYHEKIAQVRAELARDYALQLGNVGEQGQHREMAMQVDAGAWKAGIETEAAAYVAQHKALCDADLLSAHEEAAAHAPQLEQIVARIAETHNQESTTFVRDLTKWQDDRVQKFENQVAAQDSQRFLATETSMQAKIESAIASASAGEIQARAQYQAEIGHLQNLAASEQNAYALQLAETALRVANFEATIQDEMQTKGQDMQWFENEQLALEEAVEERAQTK